MSIVGGFEVHRLQITFDYVDTATGQLSRGRIAPADRDMLRAWLCSTTRLTTGWWVTVARDEHDGGSPAGCSSSVGATA